MSDKRQPWYRRRRLLWTSVTIAGIVLVSVIIVWITVANGDEDRVPPQTKVASGQLRGKWLRSRGGRDIAAFEGIAYAASPVGNRRLRRPEPPSTWKGVLSATEPGPSCPQAGGTKAVFGEEDCLYLNVYTPESVDQKVPLDVLVFIHGGAFLTGSGDRYQPDYILDRDIVFVTFNYRLGILGFISSVESGIPGNFGAKDSVAALSWVRENIASFGGNASSVTIMGQSAGAAMVHMLMYSPLANGLFHRAVALSGSAIAPWCVAAKSQPAMRAAQVARALGCSPSPADLRHCLNTKSTTELVEAVAFLLEWRNHPIVPIPPVVEEGGGEEAFLSRHPLEILASSGAVNDVPFITGFTSADGGLFVVSVLTNETAIREFGDNFDSLFPVMAMVKDHHSDHVLQNFTKKARQLYLGDRAISSDVSKELITMFTDGGLASLQMEVAKLQNIHGKFPIFLYEFAYQSQVSNAMKHGAKGTEYGVYHGDDLLLLFPLAKSFPTYVRTSQDEKMSAMFIDFIVTFASSGKPTRDESWPPAGPAGEYLFIGTSSNTSMHAHYFPERMRLWNELLLQR